MDGSGLGPRETIAAFSRWRFHLPPRVHGRLFARLDIPPEPKRSGEFHGIVIPTMLRRVDPCDVALERLNGLSLVGDHPFHKIAN